MDPFCDKVINVSKLKQGISVLKNHFYSDKYRYQPTSPGKKMRGKMEGLLGKGNNFEEAKTNRIHTSLYG